MTKNSLAMIMEWLRPVGIGLAIFFAYYFGSNAISQFHILGPFVVMLMSGTVAFESLILGEVASEKIGYAPNRAYQIQSGLANAATAMTALLVYIILKRAVESRCACFNWSFEFKSTLIM